MRLLGHLLRCLEAMEQDRVAMLEVHGTEVDELVALAGHGWDVMTVAVSCAS